MKCPTCHKEIPEADKRYRPFCSERCKLVDLDNWLSERYRISVQTEKPAGNNDPLDVRQGKKGESG